MADGSCQAISDVPEHIRKTFVVSADISAEEHVRMQAALQAFVDNSLSKTVNFPENATVEDVAKVYLLAWELCCKGITVYVTGSRDKVVLETKATLEKKQPGNEAETNQVESMVSLYETSPLDEQNVLWSESKKPRPRSLHGETYNIETPLGKAFITINENGGEQPFEVFINTAKAGSETAAVSEAIGRLISYVLRLASPISPRDRLLEIVRQLTGIGGGRSLGFGPNRVRSLPDGVGQVLAEYLHGKDWHQAGDETSGTNGNGGNGHRVAYDSSASRRPDPAPGSPQQKIGDLCPECGEAAVVNEEGCRKCYACGFSEC
jgi:ribonucleoside-diphosphate reductase alpha chain